MNSFQDTLINAQNVEEDQSAPSYRNHKTSTDIDYKNPVQQVSKDIKGLIRYVESLLKGNNKSSGQINYLGNYKINSFNDFDPIENYNILETYDNIAYYKSAPIEKITFRSIVSDTVNSSESHYVTLADNGSDEDQDNLQEVNEFVMPSDTMSQIYFGSLAVLGLFILYRIMEKSR